MSLFFIVFTSRERGRQKRLCWSRVSCYVWNMLSSRNTSLSTMPHCFTSSCPGRTVFHHLDLVELHISISMCVSLLHEWDRSLTCAHFFFFFFFFDSSGTMGFSSHAAVPERGWALLWRGGARINIELIDTGAHSALTFSFSPLKNKQGWGGF